MVTKEVQIPIKSANATDQKVNSFYKIKEVANILKVHYNVVYGLIVAGELRASKVGRSWRISQRDLDHYMGKRANS